MAEKNRTNWSDKARRITGGITLIVIILIILLCVLLGKKTNKSAEPAATVQPVPVVTEVKEQEKTEEPVTVAKDSPVVEEKVDTKIEETEVPVVEEPIKDIEVTDEPLYSSGEVYFEVCGITVQNSWSDGIFVSTSNAKERFLKDDVMAFVRYETDKYLSYMGKETMFKIIVSTGTIKIEYPSSIDPGILMPYYKNDIEEYAASIAPKEETIEEPIVKEVVEERVVEVVPETADFTVFGYKVLNSWVPGTFTSLSEAKGLLYESDVKGFAEYEIGKYGDFLLDNVAIEYVADGFVLTYPETVDPASYISQYKSDIEEYVLSLFAPVEEVEEPVTEAVPPVISGYDEFRIMGFVVENTWYDGTYLAETAINGILTEADIRGFVLYEVAKYGAFLTENVAVEYTPDGFMLSIPRELDPSPYIPVFKSDIEEYISKLFAPVEEEVVVEEPVVEETVEAPVVPEPVSNIVVSVVTDGVKVVLTEDNTSPVVEKVTSFDVSLSLGADFGFKKGRGYNPTIFPTFNITGEFRNMFSLGPIGVGTRFDAAFIFRPLDGTFIGHEFKFFLNGNNWAVDGTLDTKLMFSLDWGQTRAYLGIGVGYSLASNVSGITSHIGPQVFGFNSAVVTTGVLGLQWKLGDALFMSLEGQGRYFVQTKEYNFGGAVRIGWSF